MLLHNRLRVANLYNARAARYEEDAAPLAHYEAAGRAFLADHARPGGRVLDLGCGPGNLTRDLPPDVDVVGLDISPAMVEEARRGRPSGTYRVHDFHHTLPSDLGPFDVVIASSAFDFCEDVTQVIGHVAAAMAPGGSFYFTINERRTDLPFHGDHSLDATAGKADIRIFFWTRAETAAAVEAAGLRLVTYRHGPGWECLPLRTTIHYSYWTVEHTRRS